MVLTLMVRDGIAVFPFSLLMMQFHPYSLFFRLILLA
jgi:hypothetical protein